MHVDEELDLADAPAPKFHVPAAKLDVAVAVEVVDLLAHRADLLHGAEVEGFIPHERRQALEEVVPRLEVAGHGAGLDHRGALPSAPHALVVIQGELDGDGRGRRRWVRAQPQVCAEHIALRGARLQHGDELARQTGEELAQGPPTVVAATLRVVEDDEVDVRGVIELPRAMLAHRQGEVTPSVVLWCLQLIAFHGLPKEMRHGEPAGVVRHVREQPGAPHHVPDAEAVRHPGQDGDAVALDAQEAHEGVALHAWLRLREGVLDAGRDGVRGLGDERFRRRHVAQQEGREMGAVAEQEGEERLPRGGVEGCQEGFCPAALGGVPQAIEAGSGTLLAVRGERVEARRRGGQGQDA